MPSDTTPPVSTAELDALTEAIGNGTNLKADVTLAQKFIAADKSAIVAAIVHVAVLLVTAIGLRLPGEDVAVLGSIVTVGLTYFVSMNLSR